MFEESNPPDITIDEVETILRRFLPNQRLDIEFYYHGTYNVFIVNEEYIFRFSSTHIPKRDARELILNEVKTLEILRNRFSVEIPEPEFVDVDFGTPVVGYRRIPGISLSRCYDNTTDSQKHYLATQVASFLEDLHSEETMSLLSKDSKFNLDAYHKEWNSFFKDVKLNVYSNITDESRTWIEGLFTKFLNDIKDSEFKPCVVHGDFDTSNILVNPETLQITGIIDFEETRVYDPVADLLFFGEGEVFFGEVIRSLSENLDAGIKNRMAFHFGRQPLVYIVYGLKHDIESMVMYGLEELEKRINDWDRYLAMLDVVFRF